MADSSELVEQKAKGNECFKRGEYDESVLLYTKALKMCSAGDSEMKTTLYKNRAASLLKLGRHEAALQDCKQAAIVSPSDVKVLYRMAQALEGVKNYPEALQTVKKLLRIEPKNKDALQLAQRLTVYINEQVDKSRSTEYLVSEMFQVLEDPKMHVDKKRQAAKNFAILSGENAGAERLTNELQRLVALLDPTCNPELLVHILYAFVGICTNHKFRAIAVVNALPVSILTTLICSDQSDVSTATVKIVQKILHSFAFSGEVELESIPGSQLSLVDNLLQMLLALLVSFKLSAFGRDAILEMFMVATKAKCLCRVLTERNLPKTLLKVGANTSAIPEPFVHLPISDRTRMSVSVVLSTLHAGLSKEDRKSLEGQCCSVINMYLSEGDEASQIQGLTSLATVLQGVVQLGNAILSQDVILSKAIAMASSKSQRCQVIAIELLALSASDKDHCKKIMDSGVPLMKELFNSPNHQIKIRSLVGLCKLGSVGGWNINARTFSTETLMELQDACSGFLVASDSGLPLQKWAIEGIAFLSMDAEVKEVLIKDTAALEALFKVASSGGDQSLLYGVATVLVNLTNSYDKPEKNPELEQLGKYARENVPEEHRFDKDKYVSQRITLLLREKVVPALVAMGSCDSEMTREQVSRVFLAMSVDRDNRGLLVQQGGAKCMLSLCTGNTKHGKLASAQALAKIGITTNPELAFPGQRTLEVVRPLVALLRSDKGLQQFEALMALTNLAGVNDEVRKRIVKESGVQEIESLMFEEHELIRRAATEAMCNLVQLEEVANRFLDNSVERVKLLTLFSGEEDEQLAKAATGALAQLTSNSVPICHKMLEVKACMEVLKQVCLSDNVEIRHRGVCIVSNLIEADRELAEKIVDAPGLEAMVILNGLSLDSSHAGVKACADRALAKLVDYEMIEAKQASTVAK